MADILHHFELHQTFGHEPNRPLRMSGGWIAASQGNYVRFLPPIEQPHSTGTRPFAEGALQAFLCESLAYPGYCSRTHPTFAGSDFILIAFIHSQQDERAPQPADAGFAAADKTL